ncbi:Probable HTH-type transcriptional regulator ygaV [Serratia marcescens]|uniref:Probable HTH-type transcriptional regulator ygaV n=1 Tax=Serratia marcescens TaxID=615 RepID=A0A379ZL70_SERMA|nr:Probable HTH-type transcriptional regulator ygaV [Serratia marcescens]
MKAIGNEHRLLVLCLLLKHDEIAVGELQQLVPLSQSALSQHLAKMRNEGLVTYRREAQTLFYRIDDPNVAKVIAHAQRDLRAEVNRALIAGRDSLIGWHLHHQRV